MSKARELFRILLAILMVSSHFA